MKAQGESLYVFEWVGCIVWTLVWGSLAYLALSERSIALGAGKFGLGRGHFEGWAAIATGFLALGVAACGIGWMLRARPYRRLLRLVLLVCWLTGAAFYVLLAKP